MDRRMVGMKNSPGYCRDVAIIEKLLYVAVNEGSTVK